MSNRFEINDRDMDLLCAADLSELRGEGATEVAQRVRSEAQMRIAAQHLLTRLSQVDASIAATAMATAMATPPRAARPQPHIGFRRAAILAGCSLAAAAIAGVMLMSDAPRVKVVRVPESPMTATLNVSSSRSFAVIPTDNPDITVVWLFNKEIQ